MESAVAKRFMDGFDCTNQKHCVWFKLLADVMAEPDDDMKDQATRIIRVAVANPMEVSFDTKNVLDLVFIQFSLGLKYSRAVLSGTAWTPPSRDTLQE